MEFIFCIYFNSNNIFYCINPVSLYGKTIYRCNSDLLMLTVQCLLLGEYESHTDVCVCVCAHP